KTGVRVDGNYPGTELKKDGTLFRMSGIGNSGNQTIYSKPITGFDSNNNPILGAETIWASFPINDNLRMQGAQAVPGEITNNGTYAIFNGKQEAGFHLGGIKKGETKLKFKTSPGVVYSSNDPYPSNGEYDLRN